MTPITHVRSVCLATPDFDSERRFIGGLWGLIEVGGGDADIAYFAAKASDEPYLLRLRRADQRRTDLVAFAARDRAGVEALHNQAKTKGARIAAPPHALSSPGGGFGFRLYDLDGRLVEISAEVTRRTPGPMALRTALPVGLAHAVFHTPDPALAAAWYEEVLGLRIADWLGDGMCFLRGATSKHHCFALIAGPPALNHIAFEMTGADDMMRGLGRMVQNEIPLMWGPGRHVAGDNTFAYFLTPAGHMFEYTAEVEHLPEDWTPRRLPRVPEMMDQWGTGRITHPGPFPKPVADPAPWTPDPAGG